MAIHELVHEARLASGKTITEVAREAEVDDAHLYRFEKGERGMSSDKLGRVFKAVGLQLIQVGEHGTSSPANPGESPLSEGPTAVPLEDEPTPAAGAA
jgi:transcriptional regulator with XRE-family HTH domain